MNRIFWRSLTALLLLIGWSTSGRADVLNYRVTLNTQPLASREADQPYSFYFQFTSSNGAQGNSATFGNYNFGRDDGIGTPISAPDSTTATLSDSTTFSSSTRSSVIPGDVLTFDLRLNIFNPTGGTQDRFSFGIFTNASGNPDIPTNGPGNALFTVDFTSRTAPTITRYTTSAAFGSVTPSVTPVPEPSTLWLCAGGLAGIMGHGFRRRVRSTAVLAGLKRG